jgi:hypothetical protein
LRTTSLLQLKNYLKLLKLEKWQTLKESTSNGGGMVSGLIIMACIGVGVLIWKFIMGNPSNFEGGNNEDSFEHFRSSISWRCSAGIIRECY